MTLLAILGVAALVLCILEQAQARCEETARVQRETEALREK